jgi:hypothetical protein
MAGKNEAIGSTIFASRNMPGNEQDGSGEPSYKILRIISGATTNLAWIAPALGKISIENLPGVRARTGKFSNLPPQAEQHPDCLPPCNPLVCPLAYSVGIH